MVASYGVCIAEVLAAFGELENRFGRFSYLDFMRHLYSLLSGHLHGVLKA